MQPLELETQDASSLHRRRRPLAELLFLAFPTILQMLAYTVEQFLDTLMLARVSDLHAAAAGNSGGVVFAVLSFGFGVLMLVNALVSQSFGAREHRDCGPHLWQGIWFSLAYSVAVIPMMFLAGPIFRLMGHASDLVALEVTYFNISVSMIVVKMLAIALGQFMIAIDRPMVVFWAACTGMAVDLVLNWLLIYGNFGFPAMGIAGAAWGTNAGVCAEMIVIAIVAFGPRLRETFNTLAWRFDRARSRELLRIGVPSGFQVAGDVFAWNIFFGAVLAAYGTATLAASIYAIQFMKVAFMPAFGLGTAVTALVGRHLGEGRPDLSAARAHLGFYVAAAYMVACGLVFWLAGPQLMRIFTDDPTIIRIGALVLIFCALFQLFDAMFIIYNGALRGVQDTFVPACVQIGLCWTMIVGGGLGVSRLRPDWGVSVPWAIGCVYCAVLGFYLLYRFNTGGWRKAPRTAAFGVVPSNGTQHI